MNFKSLILLIFISSFSFTSLAEEQVGNLLDCPTHDLTQSQLKGQTFLEFIRSTIKPELDRFATDGYAAVDGDRLVAVLDLVDSKVRRQALSSVAGRGDQKLENLKAIGDLIAGTTVNLYTAPSVLSETKLVRDRYKLSTYLGLASCAGSHLKLADDNYAYNVHYGTGEVEKDDRTGRSFGASRVFQATDSSYSHYLRQLEKYITATPENTESFNTTVMETLTNTDPRRYDEVTDLGDSVLTDFFAIWIAEQDRNLMDGKVYPHWDAALFQTTLLATSFHAGQDKLTMFYADPLTGKRYFTDTTYELKWPRKDHKEETCNVDLESRKLKAASLTDYIGVHYRTYRHCGRSGVNMSRHEWRLLDREITEYLKESARGRELLENVRQHIEPQVKERRDSGIYRDLAKYLISNRTPANLSNWYNFSRSMASMLEYVRENANEITERLAKKYPAKLEL